MTDIIYEEKKDTAWSSSKNRGFTLEMLSWCQAASYVTLHPSTFTTICFNLLQSVIFPGVVVTSDRLTFYNLYKHKIDKN